MNLSKCIRLSFNWAIGPQSENLHLVLCCFLSGVSLIQCTCWF